jgi:hypothetical protein
MRKRTARILTGLGIVVVLLSLAYVIAVGVAAVQLRRAYAALARDGRPMRTADIIPPEVPDAENAALLYESAALLLQATPAPQKENLRGYLADLSARYTGSAPDPNVRARLQELFQQPTVAQALSIVTEATRRPVCRFDYDYEAGPFLKMPDLGLTRDLARVLAARACLQAETGEPNAAWDTVQSLLVLSDARRTEPLLISQLVRLATIGLSCRTIQRLCETTTPTPERYRGLIRGLATLDDGPGPLVLASDGERLLQGEATFALSRDQLYEGLLQYDSSRGYSPEIIHRLRYRWITFRPNFLGDHADFLRLMRRHTQILEEPYSQDSGQEFEMDFSDIPHRHLLTRTLLPGLSGIKRVYSRAMADLRLTRAGLALLRYKATRGVFPPALEVLGLQDTTDPFSGKSLLYRAEGQGFLLYSVAEDQKDNGGTPKPRRPDPDPRKKHPQYDQIWRFPNPENAVAASGR